MSKEKEKPTEKSLGTRYPLDVLEEMKRLAEQHERSFNREVIWALREYIARQKGAQSEQKDA
jgi:predicted HicB family RNase H-like nuclease